MQAGTCPGKVALAEAAVFKDPLMAQIRIYVNDAGKALIEKIASEAGLTGIECGPPQRF